MKTYKEFETVYIGGSDGACLLLRASGRKVQFLDFGEDNDYKAWFVNEVIELPHHYKKEFECDNWVKIYDDVECAVEINAEHIEIYRAGEMGCLIYAPNGTYRR